MRPAFDHVGPTIAAWEGGRTTPEQRVRYLGEGCYVVRDERVYACSIDAASAGRPACATGPDENSHLVEISDGTWDDEPGFVLAGRSANDMHMEAFMADLNTHRCHRRWNDTFAVAPTAIEIRDVPHAGSTVPLAQLGVALPRTLVFDHSMAIEVCRDKIAADRFRALVCTDGPRVWVKRTDQNYNDSGSLLRLRLENALRAAQPLDPSPTSMRCSQVEVSIAGIVCISTRRT
jgi:hypothetical protein